MKTIVFCTLIAALLSTNVRAQIAPPGQSSPGRDDAPQTILRSLYGSSDSAVNDFQLPPPTVVGFNGILVTPQTQVEATIYPNPVEDFFNLQFGEHSRGIYIIEVFNALGQMLSAEQFTATPLARAMISMKDYSDGLYLVTVRKLDGTETSTFRVTKNSQSEL